MDKPLFIPLKAEFYEAFRSGTKIDELRKYGPRWNEETCCPGRSVILSKGYGRQNRMQGVVFEFCKQRADTFSEPYKEAIKKVYGTLDIDIAMIRVVGLKSI